MRIRIWITAAARRLGLLIGWLAAHRMGLFTGLIAALLMACVQLLLRSTLGTPSPIELISDRLVPFLPLPVFITMIGLAGGFAHLKIIGSLSILLGELVVGTLGGALYDAVLTAPSRSRIDIRPVRAAVCAVGFFVLAWVGSLLLLWPKLTGNYFGQPTDAARRLTLMTLLIGFACYSIALLVTYTFATPRAIQGIPKPAGRRAFLLGGAGLVFAIGTGTLLARLARLSTLLYDGMQYLGQNIQAITPIDRFYAVTKNLVDPDVAADTWRLEIAGLVEQPHRYTFSELAALPTIDQQTTLMCISNEVDGGLMSNAVWTGVRLADLLAAAKPQSGAIEVVLHAADTYIEPLSLEEARSETTLLAFRINGEPLPARHGFPARLIVPGVYGEKSVKWITRVELVDKHIKGFYEQQGWGPNLTIDPRARIDDPTNGLTLSANTPAQIRGVAFGGNKGVAQVEVSVDGGRTWQDATFDQPDTPLVWVFWHFDWQPTQPGAYTLIARATDGTGKLQTPEVRPTSPEGARGYHSVTVQVS